MVTFEAACVFKNGLIAILVVLLAVAVFAPLRDGPRIVWPSGAEIPPRLRGGRSLRTVSVSADGVLWLSYWPPARPRAPVDVPRLPVGCDGLD